MQVELEKVLAAAITGEKLYLPGCYNKNGLHKEKEEKEEKEPAVEAAAAAANAAGAVPLAVGGRRAALGKRA